MRLKLVVLACSSLILSTNSFALTPTSASLGLAVTPSMLASSNPFGSTSRCVEERLIHPSKISNAILPTTDWLPNNVTRQDEFNGQYTIKETPSIPSGYLQFDRAVSINELAKSLKVGIDANVHIKIYDIGLKAEIEKNSKITDIEDVIVFYQDVLTSTDKFSLPELTPAARDKYKADLDSNQLSLPNFSAACGNEYISQIHYGGRAYIFLKMTFGSKEQRDKFRTEVSGGILQGLVSVTAIYEKATSATYNVANMSFTSYVIGGDMANLASPAACYDYASCKKSASKIIANLTESWKPLNRPAVIGIETSRYANVGITRVQDMNMAGYSRKTSDYNYVPTLGQGYDSINNSYNRAICATIETTNNVFDTKSSETKTSSFSIDSVKKQRDEIKYSIEAKVGVGPFVAKNKTEYSGFIEQKEGESVLGYTTVHRNQTWRISDGDGYNNADFSYNGGVNFGPSDSIYSRYLKRYNKLDFYDMCGDSFVNSITIGSKLYVAVKLKFNSIEKSRNFNMNSSAKYESIFDIKSKIESAGWSKSDIKSISVMAMQIGGDVSRLSNLLVTSSNGDPEVGAIECDFSDVDRCNKIFEAINKYTSTVQNGLADNNKAIIEVETKKYPDFSVNYINKNQLLSAQKYMVDEYVRVRNLVKSIEDLGDTASAQQKIDLPKLIKNMNSIESAANICFNDAKNCANATKKLFNDFERFSEPDNLKYNQYMANLHVKFSDGYYAMNGVKNGVCNSKYVYDDQEGYLLDGAGASYYYGVSNECPLLINGNFNTGFGYIRAAGNFYCTEDAANATGFKYTYMPDYKARMQSIGNCKDTSTFGAQIVEYSVSYGYKYDPNTARGVPVVTTERRGISTPLWSSLSSGKIFAEIAKKAHHYEKPDPVKYEIEFNITNRTLFSDYAPTFPTYYTPSFVSQVLTCWNSSGTASCTW